jgi:hypothetical protein
MARYLVRKVAVGVVLGALAGALLGALAGALLVAATAASYPLLEVLALTVGGIVGGAPVGAYVGFEGAGTLSDAWGATFENVEPGETWIGVRLTQRESYEHARRELARHHPRELREL